MSGTDKGTDVEGTDVEGTDVEGTQGNEREMLQDAEQREAHVALPNLTPYAAMKVVNVMLAKANVFVKVSPQAMYSRASKGVIESYRDTTDGDKWYVKGDAFAKWAKRYVDGYVNGTTSSARTDYDALAEQYEI